MAHHEDRLIALVQQEFGLPPGRLDHQTRLADLGDSLDWVNLLSEVETAFGIRIGSGQALALQTVGDLLRLLPEASLV